MLNLKTTINTILLVPKQIHIQKYRTPNHHRTKYYPNLTKWTHTIFHRFRWRSIPQKKHKLSFRNSRHLNLLRQINLQKNITTLRYRHKHPSHTLTIIKHITLLKSNKINIIITTKTTIHQHQRTNHRHEHHLQQRRKSHLQHLPHHHLQMQNQTLRTNQPTRLPRFSLRKKMH